uniref:Uncharacterized protein n=1 Tax=Setaria viridis TaxID=4556 RepID=A0A4V6D0D8_SETVI|nr:hypothetical protein SEVIR_9G038500v2 [Setaria viridis]
MSRTRCSATRRGAGGATGSRRECDDALLPPCCDAAFSSVLHERCVAAARRGRRHGHGTCRRPPREPPFRRSPFPPPAHVEISARRRRYLPAASAARQTAEDEPLPRAARRITTGAVAGRQTPLPSLRRGQDTKCGVGSKRAGRQRWHLTVTPATAARTDPISPNPGTANHVAPRRLHHVPRPGTATRPLRARGARGASSRRLLPGTALRFFRASAAAGVTGAGLVSTRVPARAPRADNIIGLPFSAPPGRRPAGPGARPFSGRHVSRSRAARRGGLASTYARVAG